MFSYVRLYRVLLLLLCNL